MQLVPSRSSARVLQGQFTAKAVCPDCRESYQPDSGTISLFRDARVVAIDERKPGRAGKFFRGRGCDACRQTGFRGRTGIFELLQVSDSVRQILLRNPDVAARREAGREQGMTTLKEDGWRKAQAGITTVEEVLRVVD